MGWGDGSIDGGKQLSELHGCEVLEANGKNRGGRVLRMNARLYGGGKIGNVQVPVRARGGRSTGADFEGLVNRWLGRWAAESAVNEIAES